MYVCCVGCVLTVCYVSLQLQDLRDGHGQDDGVKLLAVAQLRLHLPRCTAAVQAAHMASTQQFSSCGTRSGYRGKDTPGHMVSPAPL